MFACLATLFRPQLRRHLTIPPVTSCSRQAGYVLHAVYTRPLAALTIRSSRRLTMTRPEIQQRRRHESAYEADSRERSSRALSGIPGRAPFLDPPTTLRQKVDR